MAQDAGRIERFFVLMLENRSFDHMLGFSGIRGIDASTGQARTIDGFDGAPHSNPRSDGTPVPATRGGSMTTRPDPGHELEDTALQLRSGGPHAPIDNQGFVRSYQQRQGDPVEVMRGFTPEQLPILTTLAREFAVCDRWFSSLPGPTWPNRFFVHAATSGGLDDSPSRGSVISHVAWKGFQFKNGTIYSRLDDKQKPWRIYAGDSLPQALAIDGLAGRDGVLFFETFVEDVSDPGYDAAYTFIEPNYGKITSDYTGGNSQHPSSDVADGEALIKTVYEAIRASPHWPTAALIILWDEHGGFYDHVAPEAAPPTGDDSRYNLGGFDFRLFGVRVPAVVVSPLIPPNLVDHATHDHSSVLRTVEDVFGLPALTGRDAAANGLGHLFVGAMRDTPATLPAVHREAARELLRAAPSLRALDDKKRHVREQMLLATIIRAQQHRREHEEAHQLLDDVPTADVAQRYIDDVAARVREEHRARRTRRSR